MAERNQIPPLPGHRVSSVQIDEDPGWNLREVQIHMENGVALRITAHRGYLQLESSVPPWLDAEGECKR